MSSLEVFLLKCVVYKLLEGFVFAILCIVDETQCHFQDF